MKNESFIQLLQDLHYEELGLHADKHGQYAARESDTLRNFHDGALAMGQSSMEYCLTLLEKHRQALLLNARGEISENLSVIRERVRDIRLYMALFLGLKYDFDYVEVDPGGQDCCDDDPPKFGGAYEKVETPEIDKQMTLLGKMRDLISFVNWLADNEVVLAIKDQDGLIPLTIPTSTLFFDFFDIDPDKIEAEQDALYRALEEDCKNDVLPK